MAATTAALRAMRLTEVMAASLGSPEVAIGLVDGPVAVDHPDLAAPVRGAGERSLSACRRADSAACSHGTFVAGVLAARRESAAPAVAPGCPLVVRPIFTETDGAGGDLPTASASALAEAIIACVRAGAWVLNLSAALQRSTSSEERALRQALDYAARRHVVTVAAAGNEGTLAGSALTRHPWVIPVAACDRRGRPCPGSNLGSSVGRRGLSAVGTDITSLDAGGGARTFSGTSVATPFVTGAAALVWSLSPQASGSDVRWAVTGATTARPRTVVPPVLDAGRAHRSLEGRTRRPA